MRHPYEKFMRIELFSIGFAVLLGIFAFIKSYPIFMFICFYFISVSLCAEAMGAWLTYQKERAIKTIVQAAFIFILATYLFWHF